MSRKRDEPVRLDRIYTRGGDGGETSLGDGSRVSKTDPRVDAYGCVDELNATLGLVRVSASDASVADHVLAIQITTAQLLFHPQRMASWNSQCGSLRGAFHRIRRALIAR